MSYTSVIFLNSEGKGENILTQCWISLGAVTGRIMRNYDNPIASTLALWWLRDYASRSYRAGKATGHILEVIKNQ